MRSCEAVDGYSDLPEDCDDSDAEVHPDASEMCDGIDNDCDGTIDGAGSVDGLTWYVDSDGDGYGDVTRPEVACSAPEFTVADASDCDDSSAGVYPGATESCDGLDNDCSGAADDSDDILGDGEECPAQDCGEILGARPLSEDGIYWIDPDDGGAFETLCDMTSDGGGWTLVMTLVDDERMLGGDDEHNMWQMSGFNRWQDTSTFGDLYTATTSRTGDYKNRAYYALSGSDLQMVHTPNDGDIENTLDEALYIYRTEGGFLEDYGGSLFNLFSDHYPLTTGGGGTYGLPASVYFSVGSADGLHAEQRSNNYSESSPGGITFASRNSEGYSFAMCPVDYSGTNREHSCVGGNGDTGGRGSGGWGNLREWVYSEGWGLSARMCTSTWMVFYR